MRFQTLYMGPGPKWAWAHMARMSKNTIKHVDLCTEGVWKRIQVSGNAYKVSGNAYKCLETPINLFKSIPGVKNPIPGVKNPS